MRSVVWGLGFGVRVLGEFARPQTRSPIPTAGSTTRYLVAYSLETISTSLS